MITVTFQGETLDEIKKQMGAFGGNVSYSVSVKMPEKTTEVLKETTSTEASDQPDTGTPTVQITHSPKDETDAIDENFVESKPITRQRGVTTKAAKKIKKKKVVTKSKAVTAEESVEESVEKKEITKEALSIQLRELQRLAIKKAEQDGIEGAANLGLTAVREVLAQFKANNISALPATEYGNAYMVAKIRCGKLEASL